MEMAQNCHAKRKEKKRIIIGEIFCRKNDLFQHQKNNKANKQTKQNKTKRNEWYLFAKCIWMPQFNRLTLCMFRYETFCWLQFHKYERPFCIWSSKLTPYLSLCLSLCAHIFHSRSACINMCGMRRLHVTSYTAILNYISHSVKLRQCHTFGR